MSRARLLRASFASLPITSSSRQAWWAACEMWSGRPALSEHLRSRFCHATFIAVTNFPDPQNVAGTVSVDNLPAVQDVNVVSAPSAAAPYQFVGFSTNTFNGAQGIATYTLACQSTFDATARMCKSAEVVDTLVWPAVSATTRGWVRPTFQPTGLSVTLDVSGAASNANGSLSCGGWSFDAPTNLGLAVLGDGRLGVATTCDLVHPVACCAPVPLPEPSAALLQGTGVAALALLSRLR